MIGIFNPYGNQDLYIAKDFSEKLESYVERSKETVPFPRQIDAWWLALGVGVQVGLRTPLPTDRVKFNDGGILSSDPWRITHLELLALAVEGKDVLSDPRRVIAIASEYAQTGFPWIFDVVLGEPDSTARLLLRAEEFFS